jgi:hypothetical protein
MEQLIIQIVAGLAVIIIASWFGLGGFKSGKVITTDGNKTTKKWKWAMTISWFMILVGFYVFKSYNGQLTNFQNNSLQAFMGLSLIGYGFIFLFVSNFFRWLNKG